MDEFLRRAPRTLLALGALLVGFILIIAFNPPRTVCDEQLDLFRASQRMFLGAQSQKVTKSLADEQFDLCKADNGPGGCFDFFLNLRGMVDGLERIPRTCAETVGAEPTIQKWLLRALTLFAQVAWGESTTGSYYTSRKHGWLDAADFRLFCRMKTMAVRLYGDDSFHVFRESVLNSLPGADKMTREQKWSRSIFSSSCE
ncbi:MAG: hypothetical protein RBT63_04710 [Bdellovibrionales bacterium]|jgi:hypothetical protein|nr:hypothetical protein [Bdellovibrionales bacterium]